MKSRKATNYVRRHPCVIAALALAGDRSRSFPSQPRQPVALWMEKLSQA